MDYICDECHAPLIGEARTVQYAYACCAEGRTFRHLRVGVHHFCDLDCFEKYRAKYWEQMKGE